MDSGDAFKLRIDQELTEVWRFEVVRSQARSRGFLLMCGWCELCATFIVTVEGFEWLAADHS
jgi:hypothetical protein